MIRTQNLAPKLVIQYMDIPHRSKCTTEWGYNQPYMSIEWECKKKGCRKPRKHYLIRGSRIDMKREDKTNWSKCTQVGILKTWEIDVLIT